jgi:hypothetical protein
LSAIIFADKIIVANIPIGFIKSLVVDLLYIPTIPSPSR